MSIYVISKIIYNIKKVALCTEYRFTHAKLNEKLY